MKIRNKSYTISSDVQDRNQMRNTVSDSTAMVSTKIQLNWKVIYLSISSRIIGARQTMYETNNADRLQQK